MITYIDTRAVVSLEGSIIVALADSTNFLKRLKAEATSTGIDFIPRKANLDALAKLGVLIGDAENIILSLSGKDYVSGPESDYDGSAGEIWVYGIKIGADHLYIKLKLEAGRAKCISFHEAQHPLAFPLNKD